MQVFTESFLVIVLLRPCVLLRKYREMQNNLFLLKASTVGNNGLPSATILKVQVKKFRFNEVNLSKDANSMFPFFTIAYLTYSHHFDFKENL